jgi:O-antigen ligase
MFWIPLVALASIPFGVALQSVCQVLALVASGMRIDQSTVAPLLSRMASVCAFLYIAVLSVSGLLNGAPVSKLWGFLSGHIVWALLPLLVWKKKPSQKLIAAVIRWTPWVLALWAIVALSQYLWPWCLEGVRIVADVGRPKGLYSHPLTFAYVLLFFWPVSMAYIRTRPRHFASWVAFCSVTLMIFLTQSRTVQAGAILVGGVSFLLSVPKSWRLSFFVAMTLGLGALMSTDNLVGNKFRGTLTGLDNYSGYADDRLAFWHVHGLMFAEKPFFGRGWLITPEDRKPYYTTIGLADFKKPYEAHSLPIEIAVEGGLVALFLWLVWLLLQWRLSRLASPGWQRIFTETMSLFCLASLTQNSFHDSEVRWTLVLFLCVTRWMALEASPQLYRSPVQE